MEDMDEILRVLVESGIPADYARAVTIPMLKWYADRDEHTLMEQLRDYLDFMKQIQ